MHRAAGLTYPKNNNEKGASSHQKINEYHLSVVFSVSRDRPSGDSFPKAWLQWSILGNGVLGFGWAWAWAWVPDVPYSCQMQIPYG